MRVRSILALVLLLGVRTAGAVDVTECGQVVPPGEVGQLRRDLDCTRKPTWPFHAEGVYMHAETTLVLNGFTISGDDSGIGISCNAGRRSKCTVTGPGEIRGFELGVNCGGCLFVARDVAFRENDSGILIPKSGVLDAERVVASDNTSLGIWAHRVRAVDVETSRNGTGGLVANRALRVRGVTAQNNGREGVRCLSVVCGRSRISDATITGNDTLGDGYDIASSGGMRLRNVRCGRSARLRYPNWRDNDYETVKVVGSFGCADD